MPTSLTTHDVQLLLVDLALILVLARLLGALARRLGQPPVIGEITAGILLGPTLFSGAITRHLYLLELRAPLTAVADLGLVLFMFIIGYELDGALIRGRERIAVSVSLGSIALPLGSGFLLGIWLAHRHHVDRTVPFALFVGAAMSVTAFPVLARILSDRGLHRTRIGGLAIASAAVDDIVAWSLLAVVVTIAGKHGADEWHILLAPVYLAVMLLVVRPLMQQVAERFRRQPRLTPDLLAVVLVGLLLSGFATEWMGVHFIFGAFIFGAVMPRVMPRRCARASSSGSSRSASCCCCRSSSSSPGWPSTCRRSTCGPSSSCWRSWRSRSAASSSAPTSAQCRLVSGHATPACSPP